MDTTSVWRATASAPGFALLQDDLQCDVLVVGGGITGVTLALLLAEQGRKVVLLEAGEIGSGTTGHSTGNLYATTSDGISSIASTWDEAIAREVVMQRKAAVDFVELQCRQVPDAVFTRCPLVLYARDLSENDSVVQERDALVKAGCLARLDDAVPAGLPVARGRCWCWRTRRRCSRRRTCRRSRGAPPRRAPRSTSTPVCWTWTRRTRSRPRGRAA